MVDDIISEELTGSTLHLEPYRDNYFFIFFTCKDVYCQKNYPNINLYEANVIKGKPMSKDEVFSLGKTSVNAWKQRNIYYILDLLIDEVMDRLNMQFVYFKISGN